jgi:hypothetical protein
MSEQRLIVLDFTKGESYTLEGQAATDFSQQVADQWCTRHNHGGIAMSKSCCEFCLAEAAEDTQ